MSTENYSNEYKNIAPLKEHLEKNNETEAWVCGVLDFVKDEIIHRKPKPDLDFEIKNNKLLIYSSDKNDQNYSLALDYEISKDKAFISGQTYYFKEELKSLGGRWEPKEKKWYFFLKNKNAIEDLVNKIEEKIDYESRDLNSPVISLYGSMHPYSNFLKFAGGRWNAENKNWQFDIDQNNSFEDVINKIVLMAKKEDASLDFRHILDVNWKNWIKDYNEGKQWASSIGYKLKRTTTKW
ncbi:hypothetical protein OAT19_00770 [Gammaproteobacteria bacterium]|nr:hypothetical protein [Gammaproteobacteria bacterium]